MYDDVKKYELQLAQVTFDIARLTMDIENIFSDVFLLILGIGSRSVNYRENMRGNQKWII